MSLVLEWFFGTFNDEIKNKMSLAGFNMI